MRIYKKYKNFIPDSFYIKVSEQKNKKQNILINLFVIFNLIFIPINLKNLSILAEKNVKIDEHESYSGKGSFNLNTIISAIDELFLDDFEDVYIKNHAGEIIINNLKIAENINKSKLVEMNEASLIENEKYKIGVSINEE